MHKYIAELPMNSTLLTASNEVMLQEWHKQTEEEVF